MRRIPFRTSIFMLLLSALVAGCATADRKVNVLYQPVAAGTGGAGDLYLAASARQPGLAEKGTVQWIVGSVKSKEGEKAGSVVTGTAPIELFLDAFRQELSAAGYKVVQVDALPRDVSRGVDLAAVAVELDETAELVKSDGISRLTVTVVIWKGGEKIRKLEYRSLLSDFAITDRELLLPKLLQKSLQEVMKQAVPEIVRVLSGQVS